MHAWYVLVATDRFLESVLFAYLSFHKLMDNVHVANCILQSVRYIYIYICCSPFQWRICVVVLIFFSISLYLTLLIIHILTHLIFQLAGFLAFLFLLIDKLCNYKGELRNQRKVITVLNTGKQLELGTMMNEITTLRRRLKLVESQLEKEAKEKTIVATRHKTLESKHDKET